MTIRLSHKELLQKFLNLEFSTVVQLVQADPFLSDESTRLTLIRALWELGQDEEAKRHLEDLQGSVAKTSDAFLLVLAQWSAKKRDFNKAERLFQLLLDRSQTADSLVSAKIGLCQIAVMRADKFQALKWLKDINESNELLESDVLIQIQLIQAACAIHFYSDLAETKRHLRQSLRLTATLASSYHLVQTILQQLDSAARFQQMEEVKVVSEWLDALLPENAVAFRTRMKDLLMLVHDPKQKPATVQFDKERKRVLLNGQWMAFHEKPILFNFLEILCSRSQFVSKKEISEYLWQEQRYKPRIHDPRLFDIARRIRCILDEYPSNNMALLSGRLGYLLAEDSSPTPSESLMVSNRTALRSYENEI